MGLYALSESGDMYTSLTFTIDQLTANYTYNIFIVPDKTIIDVDYLDTIFGEMSVDLTGVDWVILARKVDSGSDWQDISLNENWWLYYDVSDIANGVITIYEILVNIDGTSFYEYKIVIGNAWNMEQLLVLDTTTEINLVAKSLEASVVWSSDGTPYIDMMVPLYYHDGTDYIFFADYLTDFEGKIYITDLLPIGLYMLGVTEFTITADDVVKIVTCTIESLFWRREPHLDSIKGTIEFKYFFFFMSTIKLRGNYHD